MAVEIYVKNLEDDTDYDASVLEISDEIDIYMNQIRNIFSAEEGQIMGATDMGLGLGNYVFESKISAERLREIIVAQIQRYSSYYSKYNTQIDVKFAKGTIRDMAVIDITVANKRKMKILFK